MEFTDQNTTCFDDGGNDDDIYMITDYEGGLLISERGHWYPVLIYDKSRKDIDYDNHKAYELRRMYEWSERGEVKKSRFCRAGGAGTPVALSGSFHSRPTSSAPKTTTMVENDLDVN